MVTRQADGYGPYITTWPGQVEAGRRSAVSPQRLSSKPEKSQNHRAGGDSVSSFRSSVRSCKPRRALSHKTELTRGVQQLLNMVCPDNLCRIVKRFDGIAVQGPDDLELMISLIIQKVLDEPHFCETYADLVCLLRFRYPDFPPETEGKCHLSFARVLIGAVQKEFEAIPSVQKRVIAKFGGCIGNFLLRGGLLCEKIVSFATSEPQDSQRKRALANMRFIGNLFLRELLGEKTISSVLSELLSGPEEHLVECACVLLQVIGCRLDATTSGKSLMTHFLARLADMGDDAGFGSIGVLSKRLRYKIQDLQDLRARGWQEKRFREQARTKVEVRRDAEVESRCAGGARTTKEFVHKLVPLDVDAASPDNVAEHSQHCGMSQARRLISSCARGIGADGVVDALCRAGLPADAAAEQGIARCLLEVGFAGGAEQLQGVYAEVLARLVSRGALSWATLGVALEPLLGRLSELMLDAPHADRFFAMLFARLVLCDDGRGIDLVVKRALPSNEKAASSNGNELVWSLLLGALRWVNTWSGPQLVQWAVGRREFSATLRSAGKCSRRELARILQSEGIVPQR